MNNLIKNWLVVLLFQVLIFFSFFTVTNSQEVFLNIQETGQKTIKIGVEDFTIKNPFPNADKLCTEATQILISDLGATGIFNVFSGAFSTDGQDPFVLMKNLSAQALVRADLNQEEADLVFSPKLFDVELQNLITGKIYKGQENQLRRMVHFFADEIVFRFTGNQGISSSKVAFISDRSKFKELWIMDADGYNPIQLTQDASITVSPAWSPDGSKIAFTSFKQGTPALYLLDLKGRQVKLLCNYPGINTAPNWSPKGDKLAVSLSKDGNAEIYILDLSNFDNSEAQKGKRKSELKNKRLTFNQCIDSSPCWSPNERELAFTSDRSGKVQIYLMDDEGGNVRRVTFSGKNNDSPAWSPNGGFIAFISEIEGFYQICLLQLSNNTVTQLTFDSADCEDPGWAPDGRHLAYSSRKGGKSCIYVIDIFSGSQKQITGGQSNDNSPSWAFWNP